METTPPDPRGAGRAIPHTPRFRAWSWKLDVPKERAIRERFGFSPARYHQLLNRLIDQPEALAYDPMLVRRLLRVREVRRRRRVAGQLGVRL